MNDSSNLLQIARDAASVGARLLSSTPPGRVTTKSERDYVTELDVKIQEAVQGQLAAATPDIGFIGEEAGADVNGAASGTRWALDPIDGTSNFVHGISLCAVSLALVVDQKPVVGVINAPFLNLEYFASESHGAYSNGKRITASETSRLGDAIISIGDYAVGSEADQKNRERLSITAALASNIERIRMFGSAALDLAWVAEGRTDGCVIMSNKPWDTSAGVLIASESGALVTDSDGTAHSLTSRHTVAAAPHLAPHLLRLLAESMGTRSLT